MGSYDLDDHIFVPLGHKVIGIKAHCPIDGIYENVGMTCRNGLLQALGNDEEHWLLFFRGGAGSESWLATTLVRLI
tara:strand:- start:373 stop:600 length:228 start_codon:yes stop_codon:yes gene_type:complete